MRNGSEVTEFMDYRVNTASRKFECDHMTKTNG